MGGTGNAVRVQHCVYFGLADYPCPPECIRRTGRFMFRFAEMEEACKEVRVSISCRPTVAPRAEGY